MDAAIWGAELAFGDTQERIYIVEPTGSYEDDPNLTDKNFPAIRRSPIAVCIRLGLLVKLQNG